jgi:hypothetical protein
MLAQASTFFSHRKGGTLRAQLAEILDVLRRIWTALKERLAPIGPKPAPVPVRGVRGDGRVPR